ncbi:MAG: flagellar hook-basal body complex protein FliE [Rhizobiales bacterium]|nr:flagellar hook-basal body complex protein FliE [Hyphomicrobiales bacterium]MBI3672802.1 flagellar hook-basal body complex protein FliE [Hyphomicrobiales bacterium]
MIGGVAPVSGLVGAGLPAGVSSAIASPAAGQGFGSVLASLVSQASDALKQGEAAGIAGMQGTMPIQQVVDQVLEAERTLQTTVAIRDKLVGALLEISRMQI